MDPNGFVNEVFKDEYAGSDMKNALLALFNGIKRSKQFPTFMTVSDICSIQKKKSSILDFDNQRGISLITVYKKVFENLLYNDFVEDIDNKMTDSNIGARAKRDIKDHLIIMNGVINSVVKGKEKCIDVQIFDLEKAFDSIWLENCLIDVHDSLTEKSKIERLALL